MKANWLMVAAAGAALGMMVPMDAAAQGNSNRARQQQEVQRQREQARETARQSEERRQSAERDRLRRQREAANRAGLVLQRNDNDRARRERDRRDDRRYDPRGIYDRRDDRYDPRDRRDTRYDRRGPAFCRSGEGHPVHGRRWCTDKGFGLGREQSRDVWGDIIFGDRRYDNRQLSRSTLGDILGSVVLGRFDSYGRTYYGNGALSGRWIDNRATVLQLYMGSVPIARLTDTNRDGRVDAVSLLR